MENIIVEIMLAATGDTVDFMLPAHIAIGEMMKDLVQLVEQVYQQVSFGDEQPVLFNHSETRPIPLDMTLAQAGIRDGHRLLLV